MPHGPEGSKPHQPPKLALIEVVEHGIVLDFLHRPVPIRGDLVDIIALIGGELIVRAAVRRGWCRAAGSLECRKSGVNQVASGSLYAAGGQTEGRSVPGSGGEETVQFRQAGSSPGGALAVVMRCLRILHTWLGSVITARIRIWEPQGRAHEGIDLINLGKQSSLPWCSVPELRSHKRLIFSKIDSAVACHMKDLLFLLYTVTN